jgi:DNA-binding MarR family transcriptional regulator
MSLFFPPDDEELRFADETELLHLDQSWKILIVDDEAEVHTITQLALREFAYEGKSLAFLNAYSAQEAKQLIQAHPDTAIIFLDVVMETEDAGLRLVQYIREELCNALVRIILRTGQPGQAPEQVVAVNYGIDDYKTKTELTAQKLTISVVTALRAFSTLMHLTEISRSLESSIMQHQQLDIALRASDSQTNGLQTMSTITRIARTALRITDEHSAKFGISQTKLAVLMYLGGEPNLCASPSALAKHCGVSRAAMTGLLDGLEEEGYVERDSHPSDRRALTITLTQKGQQFLDWVTPQDQYHLPEIIDTLSAVERQQLYELAVRAIKLFG